MIEVIETYYNGYRPNKGYNWFSNKLKNAYLNATQTRFEHRTTKNFIIYFLSNRTQISRTEIQDSKIKVQNSKPKDKQKRKI